MRTYLPLVLLLYCLLQAFAVQAQVSLSSDHDQAPRFLARIQLHSAAELAAILSRADDLFQRQGLAVEEPIVLVLHGAEARVFLRHNYSQHKHLVDRAARLAAFDIVDIKVCERWLGGVGVAIDGTDLVPFVGTVPYGPAEIKRLRGQEGYLDF